MERGAMSARHMGRGRTRQRGRGGKSNIRESEQATSSHFPKDSKRNSKDFKEFIKEKYSLLNSRRAGRRGGRGRGRGVGKQSHSSRSRNFSKSPENSRRSRSRSFERRSRSRSCRRSRSRSFEKSRSRSFERRSRSRSFERRSRSRSFDRRPNSPLFDRRPSGRSSDRRSRSRSFDRRLGSQTFGRRSRSQSPVRRSRSQSPLLNYGRRSRSGSRISSERFRCESFPNRSYSRPSSPITDRRELLQLNETITDHLAQIRKGCSSPVKENIRITIDNEHFSSNLKSRECSSDAEETNHYWRRNSQRNQSDAYYEPNLTRPRHYGSTDEGQFHDNSNPTRLPHKENNLATSSNGSSSGTQQVLSMLANLKWPMSEPILGVNSLVSGPSNDRYNNINNIHIGMTNSEPVSSSFRNLLNGFVPKDESERPGSPVVAIPGLEDFKPSSDDVDRYLYGEDNDQMNMKSRSLSVDIKNSTKLIANKVEEPLNSRGIELQIFNRIMPVSEDALKRCEEGPLQTNVLNNGIPLDPRLRRRSSTTSDCARRTAKALKVSAHEPNPSVLSSSKLKHNSEMQTTSEFSAAANFSNFTSSLHDMPLPSFGRKNRSGSSNITIPCNAGLYFSGKNRLNTGNLRVLTSEVEPNMADVLQDSSNLQVTNEKSLKSIAANESRLIFKNKDRTCSLHDTQEKKLHELTKKLEVLKNKELELIKCIKRRKDGQIDPELVDNDLAQKKVQQLIENTKRSLNNIKRQMALYEAQLEASVSPEKANHLNQVTSPLGTSKLMPKVHYRYVDYGTHWCKHCSDIFPHVQDFLKHLHRDHLNVMGDLHPLDRPWVVKPEDIQDATNIQPLPLQGIEFMLPCSGFFCNLCKEFYGDLISSQIHLESEKHNKNYKKFVQENTYYETKLSCEKNIVLAKKKKMVESKLTETMKGAFKIKNSEAGKLTHIETASPTCIDKDKSDQLMKTLTITSPIRSCHSESLTSGTAQVDENSEDISSSLVIARSEMTKEANDECIDLKETMSDASKGESLAPVTIEADKRTSETGLAALISDTNSPKKDIVTIDISMETDGCRVITKPGAKIPIKLKEKGVSDSIIKNSAKETEVVTAVTLSPEKKKDNLFKKKPFVIKLQPLRGCPPPLEEFITIESSSSTFEDEIEMSRPLKITPQIQMEAPINVNSDLVDQSNEKDVKKLYIASEETSTIDLDEWQVSQEKARLEILEIMQQIDEGCSGTAIK